MAGKAKSIALEAIKASSLACHTGAGLLTQLRKGEKVGTDFHEKLAVASRLLRSAESLTRSAAALMGPATGDKASKDAEQKSDGNVTGGKTSKSPSRSAKRRQRRRRVAESPDVHMGDGGSGGGYGVGDGASLQTGPLVSPNSLDHLRQGLLQTFGGGNNSGIGSSGLEKNFCAGVKVKVTGLSSEPQYNGCLGHVVAAPESSHASGRIPVKLLDNGKEMLLKKDNLVYLAPPLFGFPFG